MSFWYIPLSVLIAGVISNLIKEIIHVYTHKRFSWYTLVFETGGMPSTHSSTVTALTVAVLLQEGMTPLFWVSLLFALVVIRDAFGVRKSVADQARILNLLTSHMKLEEKVTVVLGHTPYQVMAGIVLGIAVSLTMHFII